MRIISSVGSDRLGPTRGRGVRSRLAGIVLGLRRKRSRRRERVERKVQACARSGCVTLAAAVNGQVEVPAGGQINVTIPPGLISLLFGFRLLLLGLVSCG